MLFLLTLVKCKFALEPAACNNHIWAALRYFCSASSIQALWMLLVGNLCWLNIRCWKNVNLSWLWRWLEAVSCVTRWSVVAETLVICLLREMYSVGNRMRCVIYLQMFFLPFSNRKVIGSIISVWLKNEEHGKFIYPWHTLRSLVLLYVVNRCDTCYIWAPELDITR